MWYRLKFLKNNTWIIFNNSPVKKPRDLFYKNLILKINWRLWLTSLIKFSLPLEKKVLWNHGLPTHRLTTTYLRNHRANNDSMTGLYLEFLKIERYLFYRTKKNCENAKTLLRSIIYLNNFVEKKKTEKNSNCNVICFSSKCRKAGCNIYNMNTFSHCE